MTEPSLDVVRLDAVDEAALRAHAVRAYGPDGVPARPSFLRWLYDEAPHGLGRSVGVAAVSDGVVVGVMHALRLPFQRGTERSVVLAPNHLHVEPAYRTGVGLALVMESLRGYRDALLLGASPDVAPVYERLGAVRLEASALATVASPLRGAFALALARLAPEALDRAIAGRVGRRRCIRLPGATLRLEGRPDSARLDDLACTLRARARGRAFVAYDAGVLAHRHFHPLGPRSLLLTLERRGEGPSYAVLSLGIRGGVPLARVVVFAPSSTPRARALAGAVRVALSTLEVPVALASTSERGDDAALRSVGFVARAAPAAFALRRPRDPHAAEVALDGGASDQGFDAIPRTEPRP